MANTTNLNLVKPAGTDYALVSVINGNMDIIDSKVGAIPANESAQSQITALNNQLAKTTGSGTTNTTYISSGTVAWSKTGKMVVVYFSDITFSQGVSGNIELITGLPKATDTVVFALFNYADNKAYRFRISNTATSAYAFYAGIPSGANLFGQCVYFTE